MEMEIPIGVLIAILVIGLSVVVMRRATFFPDVTLPEPSLPCPDVPVNVTEQEFHRALSEAKSGCDFNATLKFVLSDSLLSSEAGALGLKDASGNPTVLKTQSCDIPFHALIVCNGTVFPGDRVRLYSKEGVIIEKLGR